MYIYGTEACGLVKSHVRSLYLVVFRFFMKLFRTDTTNFILEIVSIFTFKLSSFIMGLTERSKSFLASMGFVITLCVKFSLLSFNS